MITDFFTQKIKIISIDSIDRIYLRKSSRARHLAISIQPFKGVRISIPRGVSFAQAELFARSKADWIVKHQQRIKRFEQQQQTSKANILPFNREEAKRILTDRLNELAQQNGFHYQKVFIRNQTTRWGSCSVKNNINLNQKLMHLPAQLIDYVLLHELVHTRIKNHSPKFWAELVKYVPAAKTFSKELRIYGTELL